MSPAPWPARPTALTGCPGCTAGSSLSPGRPAPGGPREPSSAGPPHCEHGAPSGPAGRAPEHPASKGSAGGPGEGCGRGLWPVGPPHHPQRLPAPNRPEGDEVGVDEGRAEEGPQQPQDGRARGHVPPPDLGQESLKQRHSLRSPPPHTHTSAHAGPDTGRARQGSAEALRPPPPPAIRPGGDNLQRGGRVLGSGRAELKR